MRALLRILWFLNCYHQKGEVFFSLMFLSKNNFSSGLEDLFDDQPNGRTRQETEENRIASPQQSSALIPSTPTSLKSTSLLRRKILIGFPSCHPRQRDGSRGKSSPVAWFRRTHETTQTKSPNKQEFFDFSSLSTLCHSERTIHLFSGSLIAYTRKVSLNLLIWLPWLGGARVFPCQFIRSARSWVRACGFTLIHVVCRYWAQSKGFLVSPTWQLWRLWGCQ